jgi:hypothetical protein
VGAAGTPVARAEAHPATGQPQQIRRRAVRLAAVWASVRPGKQVAGRTGSERIGRGHAHLWPLVCLGFPLRFSIAAQVLDEKSLRKDGGVLRLRRRRCRGAGVGVPRTSGRVRRAG